jgi:lysophospholipase L1-like esterase
LNRLVNLAVFVGVGLLCLGLTELVLWAVAPLSLEERVEFHQSLPGLQETVVYERDALGLRTAAASANDVGPWDTRRILCLGGSTTEQVPQSFHDTWCGSLAEKINDRLAESGSGTRVESAIFGRGGFRTVDVFDWATENLDAVDPDLVIVLLGVNDLAWNGGPEYSYDGLESAIAASRSRWGESLSLGGRCRQVMQLCRRLALAKRRLQHLRAGPDAARIEWHSDSLPSLRETYRKTAEVSSFDRDPDPITEFGDALDAMASLVTERELPLVVLGQPVLWHEGLSDEEAAALWFRPATPTGPVRVAPGVLAGEMDRYNSLQQDIARRHGAWFVDLDARIPRTLEYFFDDCHFTDVGSHRVAEEILPTVERALRLARDGSDRGVRAERP